MLTNLKGLIPNTVTTLLEDLCTPKQEDTPFKELLSKLATLGLPGELRGT